MKKSLSIVILIIIILLCVNVLAAKPSRYPRKQVTVTNAEEFLSAIAPNTDIYIDMPDMDAIVLSGPSKKKSTSPHYRFEDAYDGVQLVIQDVKGLSISGPEKVHARLLSPYSYANVLVVENCSDIQLNWLNCGHEVEGYCTGGVLVFDKCRNVQIDNCDLWGCGVEGINIVESSDISCSSTTIRDCSYSIMSIHSSSNIRFEYCLMHDNREFDQMNFTNSSDIVFENCVIWNNTASGYYGSSLVQAVESDVLFQNCAIFNNSVEFLGMNEAGVAFDDCIIFGNYPRVWDY